MPWYLLKKFLAKIVGMIHFNLRLVKFGKIVQQSVFCAISLGSVAVVAAILSSHETDNNLE